MSGPELEVPFCDLRAAWTSRQRATEAALLRVARSGRYVLGPEVAAFEHELATLCGSGHAVGVGNGTDALALILRAAGIGSGSQVVVPAYTAAATWVAVAMAGAEPVGADVDADTGLIDPDAAAAVVGTRTQALIAVHLFGRLAPMGRLRELARRHGLLLIEDAAHAGGVREADARAGSLGDAAALSFYPTKPLGGLGDGGAVVTHDADLAAEVRRLRSYGWSQWQGQIPVPGVNSRLDEIQAAVLRERLRELPSVHTRLRRLGMVYRERLQLHPELALPPLPDTGEPPWHQFAVGHGERDGLRAALRATGIGTAIHYEPLPPQLAAFAAHGAPPPDRFPRACAMAAQRLSLPFDAWLSDDQADAVCVGVSTAIGSIARSAT